MADPNFIFDPPTGHNDTTVFPTNPSKEQTRGLFQRLHDQTRDFINGTFLTWIKNTFATKTEIGNIVLGQIPDGSLTDVKLSDEAGQIKDTVSQLYTNKQDALPIENRRKIILWDGTGDTPTTEDGNILLQYTP